MPNNHSLQSENLAKLKEVLDKRYYGTSPFTNLDSTDEGKVIGVVKNRQGEYEAKPVSMNPASCPIGSIIAWPTPTIPVGFLVCNGQAVSRVSFKKLFDKIGITYGAGDGSTTFNVPDLRDKFIEGGNTSDANLDTAIAAGLPNLRGTVSVSSTGKTYPYPINTSSSGNGVLYSEDAGQNLAYTKLSSESVTFQNANTGTKLSLDASKNGTDLIYGKSSTVQPPAIKMLYIICTGDSTPESIVDSMQLANTDGNSTIKFGKDNLGNYGYYKGDDPTFNPFINPGDISATYDLICTKNSPTASETLTLSKSIADYDCALIECIDGNNAHWDGMIHKPAYNTTVMIERGNGSNECIRANINGTTCTVSVSGWSYNQYKIYGVKYRAEVDPPTSMKLSTDLTKEIRFGQEDGDNGYYVDDNTFIPFREGGQTLYHHQVLISLGAGSDTTMVRSYVDFVLTSSEAINTKAKLMTVLNNNVGNFISVGGWFSTSSCKGTLSRVGVVDGTVGIGGPAITGSNVGTFQQLEVTDAYSISDSVKVIGAAAVSSLPTAPSSGMFLMSNSTGEGEWSNAAVPPTPTAGQRVLTSNSNGTSAWTYFDPTTVVGNNGGTPSFAGNIDDILVDSTYNVGVTGAGTHPPFSAMYFLVTKIRNNDNRYGVQIAYNMNSDTSAGYVYFRRKTAGSWEAWRRVDGGTQTTSITPKSGYNGDGSSMKVIRSGNMVTVAFNLHLTTAQTGGLSVIVEGLPNCVCGSGSVYGGCTGGGALVINNNDTKMQGYINCASGGYISGQFTYPTA